MSSASPRLSLPYIAPAQAQKHVTHNEALRLLDIIAQLNVLSFSENTPPASVSEGDTYVVGTTPTADWVGQAGNVAAFSSGSWLFITPTSGWYATSAVTGELRVYDGENWQSVSPDTQNLDGVGVGTNWNSANRLAVASDATLLTHVGSDHQLKINKDSAGDTASLLFQTGFDGKAEMGLNGSDDFSVKVSADATNWNTALTADAATGHVTVPRVSSGFIDIEGGTVGLIPTPGAGGFVMITIVDDTYPQNDHSGIFVYDVGSSPKLVAMTTAPAMFGLNTDVLTGTTGASGTSSVAASAGQLQIENNTAHERRYSYLFLCGN